MCDCMCVCVCVCVSHISWGHQGLPQCVKEYAESSYSQNEFLVYNQDQVHLRYLVCSPPLPL